MDNPEMREALSQCLVRTMKTHGVIQELKGQNQSTVVLLEPSKALPKIYGVRNELPTIKCPCPGILKVASVHHPRLSHWVKASEKQHSLEGWRPPAPNSHINPNPELGQKPDKNEKLIWRREQSTRQWLKKLHTKVSQQGLIQFVKLTLHSILCAREGHVDDFKFFLFYDFKIILMNCFSLPIYLFLQWEK